MAGMFGGQAAPPAQDMYFDDWGVGSNLSGDAASKFEAVAQQLASQGVPPPTPGSLQKMMNDPNLRAMMMGAIQGSYGGQGTSTSTGEVPGAAQASTGQNILGAGLAGLGTYSMLSGSAGTALFGTAAAASMVAPWAAGAVALASLLM